MKMIIAGGRNYAFSTQDYIWLNGIVRERGPVEEVVTGGATGADDCGGAWALENELTLSEFHPDWTTLGKAAGPIRNREMAEYVGKGGLCVLFPGGRGTASMKREAAKAGLTIIERTT